MKYKIIEKWHLYSPGYSDQQKNPTICELSLNGNLQALNMSINKDLLWSHPDLNGVLVNLTTMDNK